MLVFVVGVGVVAVVVAAVVVVRVSTASGVGRFFACVGSDSTGLAPPFSGFTTEVRRGIVPRGSCGAAPLLVLVVVVPAVAGAAVEMMVFSSLSLSSSPRGTPSDLVLTQSLA